MTLLRPYQDSDWPQLCEIHDLARKDELRASGLLDAFLSLEQTAENEGLFEAEVTVAVVDAVVRGFVATRDGELTWLYVHPNSYRTGIGRALLRHAIAANQGNLTADVLVGNEAALTLYLAEGFEVKERLDGQLVGNESFAASGYLLERKQAPA